jgi:fructose-1-phosphate kinase PfkB-like protein
MLYSTMTSTVPFISLGWYASILQYVSQAFQVLQRKVESTWLESFVRKSASRVTNNFLQLKGSVPQTIPQRILESLIFLYGSKVSFHKE